MSKFQVLTMSIPGGHSRVLIKQGFNNYAAARKHLTQTKRIDADYVSNHTRFESKIIKVS